MEIYRGFVRDELKPMPGAVELLRELEANDIPRALATSAARVSTDLVLARFGLASYFGTTVTFEGVTNHKPDPEVFLKAAAGVQMPPERCIVIEDGPKGLRAAKAAGMNCIVVPTPLYGSTDLSAADLVADSLEELSVERLAVFVEKSRGG
jgi:HAD superfamily hydrolase (TIGR01509 family)